MTILELEKRTGLDRSAIRYYEKEGLINPERKENSYRDYSEEIAQEIMKIKLLRQLDISIEQIRRLQQGSADMSSLLRDRARELNDEAYYTDRAANICQEISDQQVSYAQFDPTAYLDKLNASPQAEGTKRAKEWNFYPYEFHPWKRFFARALDYALITVLVDFLLTVVLRIRPMTDLISNLVTFGTIFLSVPLQAYFLSKFGTTPGKWLFGIRLVGIDGRNLSYSAALTREWNALRYGYGFGIPFYQLYRYWKSYKLYRNRECLPQDSGTEHLYDTYEPVSKKAFLAGVCAVLVAVTLVSAFDTVKPKYRGDLTVAEFAENYNFYTHVINESNKTRTDKDAMRTDGTWNIEKTENKPNTIIISTYKGQSVDYVYQLEGERIRSISYTNSWTEIQYWTMPGHFAISTMTVLMSQKGMNFAEASKLLNKMSEQLKQESGEFVFDNITIRWKLESIGCHGSNGTYIGTDDIKNSSITLHYEILIA